MQTFFNKNGIQTNLIEDSDIEYGSNQNGEYWKFPNGLLICKKKIYFEGIHFNKKWSESIFQAASPQDLGNAAYDFNSLPFVFVHAINRDVMNEGGIHGTTNHYLGSVFMYRPFETVMDFELHVIAIGRWK